MDQLLTTAQVAAAVGVRPETVRSWRYTGRGPVARKVGRLVRYRTSDVQTWLESQPVIRPVA